MKREIITTSDGSKTIQIVDWEEQYHSIHGAVQESMHIYIGAGLNVFHQNKVSILEMGFGTGLNCFLTYQEGFKKGVRIDYTGVEGFPISNKEHQELGYQKIIEVTHQNEIEKIYSCYWEVKHSISPTFELIKIKASFETWIPQKNTFDLIYFDAFGPPVQPELWSIEIFKKMFSALKEDGILVTYCAKGQVKRNLREVGFLVENLPGPPMKREITRARKVEAK